MAIEKRGRRRYLYLGRRVDRRTVKKEYFGAVGSVTARIAAALIAEAARERRLTGQWQAGLADAARAVRALFAEAAALTRETLAEAGFRRAGRHWRLPGAVGRRPAASRCGFYTPTVSRLWEPTRRK